MRHSAHALSSAAVTIFRIDGIGAGDLDTALIACPDIVIDMSMSLSVFIYLSLSRSVYVLFSLPPFPLPWNFSGSVRFTVDLGGNVIVKRYGSVTRGSIRIFLRPLIGCLLTGGTPNSSESINDSLPLMTPLICRLTRDEWDISLIRFEMYRV